MAISSGAMKKGVYLICNTLNGKCYVGSSRNIPQRWRQHRHTLKAGTSSCRRLQAAWKKYGADAFSFEILEIVSDDERRGQREQFWLDALGTFRCGYNASPTVQVSEYMPRPPEWGRAISAAKRGKKIKASHNGPHSAEHKARISAGLKKHYAANPLKRPPHSPERRAQISAACKRAFSEGRGTRSEVHRSRLSAATKRAWADGRIGGRFGKFRKTEG